MCKSWISELDRNRSLCLVTNTSNGTIYCEGSVSICSCWNRCLQDSRLDLLVMILNILFWILKIFLLKWELPQNIMPYDIIEWKFNDMTGLIALMAKQTLFSLEVRSEVWSFQERELSMVRPKNLVLFTFKITEMGTTIWIFTSFFFCVKNCRKCVFLKYNVSKLLCNHLIVLFIMKKALFWNSCRSAFETVMLVSLANSIGLAALFRITERSFMYIRNSSGPNTEPCGTPCSTGSQLEVNLLHTLSFNTTLFCLSAM